MSKRRGAELHQWLKERIFGVADEIIAGLLLAALFSVLGYLNSQAIAWNRSTTLEIALWFTGAIGIMAVFTWFWRARKRRPARRKPTMAKLGDPWQGRVSMLRALCKAGRHKQEGLKALKSQKWSLAWVSFEQAICEVLSYCRIDASLMDAIEGLKTRGACRDEEWQQIKDNWEAVLQDIVPKASEVCGVELPFDTEIINDLQNTIAGMEETYQQAMRLQERRAWWKALIALRSILIYRDASAQVIQLVVRALATVAALLAVVVGAIAIFVIIARSGPEPPEPTVDVMVPLETLTFTITCAIPPSHTVQAGEPITLSAVNAVFIEPSVTPKDWDALTGTLLRLPAEEKKFSYAPQGSLPDMLTFTFLKDSKTGLVATKVLPITIVSERCGLCYP